ncbi:Rid family hydrolase [Actinacidiphila yeochonensis]|uniref:Rid family hydrolase n=1 Tax=Actinacidiphila yeochonensis TaxID=89050 RepID=UPI0007C6AACF|nr:Rid family hydrolase [Actinacidiphila yeochonensis]
MTSGAEVRRELSGTPWEEATGSAGAVAVGGLVLVSGRMPVPEEGAVAGAGEPYEQTAGALRDAVAALEPFGLAAEDVVRTRVYLSHARDADEAGRAHREVLGHVRPALTMVVVAGFTDSRVLVEVEIEAHAGGRDARVHTAPAASDAADSDQSDQHTQPDQPAAASDPAGPADAADPAAPGEPGAPA